MDLGIAMRSSGFDYGWKVHCSGLQTRIQTHVRNSSGMYREAKLRQAQILVLSGILESSAFSKVM